MSLCSCVSVDPRTCLCMGNSKGSLQEESGKQVALVIVYLGGGIHSKVAKRP